MFTINEVWDWFVWPGWRAGEGGRVKIIIIDLSIRLDTSNVDTKRPGNPFVCLFVFFVHSLFFCFCMVLFWDGVVR